MKELKSIKKQYDKLELTAEKALELVFDLYLVSESTLADLGFTLECVDYGMWRLIKPNTNPTIGNRKDYVFEGSYDECCERFNKIRYSR
jgi:hypothetical protein